MYCSLSDMINRIIVFLPAVQLGIPPAMLTPPSAYYVRISCYLNRAGATGTAMAVPTSQKVGPRGTFKTGEKKFRCMILYRESPGVQDLPSKFQKCSGGGPPHPLKDGPLAAPLCGSCLRPCIILMIIINSPPPHTHTQTHKLSVGSPENEMAPQHGFVFV